MTSESVAGAAGPDAHSAATARARRLAGPLRWIKGRADRLRRRPLAERAAEHFLSAIRAVSPPMLPEPVAPSALILIPHWPGTLVVRHWGEGPAVLLVHGRRGDMRDLDGWIGPLIAGGYSAIAVDLPGHGRSGGERGDVVTASGALQAVCGVTGPLHALIAHDRGGLAAMLALEQGIAVDRVVLIALPDGLHQDALRLAADWRLSAHQTVAMIACVEQALGRPLASFSGAALAPGMARPLLLVHAVADLQHATADVFAAHWPNSEIHLHAGPLAPCDDGLTAPVMEFVVRAAGATGGHARTA